MHEETPVDSILNGYSFNDVFAEIESILEDSKPETIAHTLGFVRDASLYQHPLRDAFQKHLASSSIWNILQKLLVAPNFWVRRNTVYTIAKLTQRDRAYLLSEAFPFYLEKDPINLPNLILELVWLTNQWNWNFIEQAAVAKHFLQRWSLCELLDDNGSPPEVKSHFLDVLERLKTDSEPLVAAEAALRFERVNIKIEPKLSKSEWRKEVKKISSLEPRVTFESTAMQFMRERADYTLDEFERFVKELV